MSLRPKTVAKPQATAIPLPEPKVDFDAMDRIQADEIIDGTKPEHIFQVAKNWVCTAAKESRNSDYWQEKADLLEKEVEYLKDQVKKAEHQMHQMFNEVEFKQNQVDVLIRTIDGITSCHHDDDD